MGRHLAQLLLEGDEAEVTGTIYLPTEYRPDLAALANLHQVDLTDAEAVEKLLTETRPKHIYHLAAQSFVPESFDDPWGTLRNNIKMQLNIILSMIKLDLDARLLVVGSAEVYGPVSPDEIPLDEDQPLRPPSPYSVSKVAQDMLGLQYYLSHSLDIVRVRPFNQIGPGQSKRFVAPAFASQIAAIEAGLQEPAVYVGNLEAQRDFTDVRDMVEAYRLLMVHGKAGEVYNVGTGEAHSIQELLNILLHYTHAPVEVRTDPALMRPVDVPIIVCNPAKVQAATGWKPAYAFEQTLLDILNDWRQRVRQVPG